MFHLFGTFAVLRCKYDILVNFDAKTRRNSTDLEDIFIGHISSMDTLARGLMAADGLLNKSNFLQMKNNRYKSFDDGDGSSFEKGNLGIQDLAYIAETIGAPLQTSGKQELFEAIVNQHIK